MHFLGDDEISMKWVLVTVMNCWQWGRDMRCGSEEVRFTSENDLSHKKKLRLS